MAAHFTLPEALGLLMAGIGIFGADTIKISVPKIASARTLRPDVWGYSIEPVWVDSYIRTHKTRTLIDSITAITGKPPPIRVGGNTADQTYLHAALSTRNVSLALPDPRTAQTFNVTPDWYQTWGDYLSREVDLIYTLNLADNRSAWANAVQQAEFACTRLG